MFCSSRAAGCVTSKRSSPAAQTPACTFSQLAAGQRPLGTESRASECSVRTHAPAPLSSHLPSVALSIEALQNGASQRVHVYNAHFLHLSLWSFFSLLMSFSAEGPFFGEGGVDAVILGRKGRSRMSSRRLLGLVLLCFVYFRGGQRFNSEDPTAESGF